MVNYYLLDTTFAALADPIRRAILQNLSQKDVPAGGLAVTSLAEPFDISLPAISRHLKVLEKAGLIVRQREGRVRRCGLDAAPLREADRWIGDYRRFWEDQLGALADYLGDLNVQEEEI